MNNSNICYIRNREKLLEQAKNRYHQNGDKKQLKDYYKNNKERLQEQVRKM